VCGRRRLVRVVVLLHALHAFLSSRCSNSSSSSSWRIKSGDDVNGSFDVAPWWKDLSDRRAIDKLRDKRELTYKSAA